MLKHHIEKTLRETLSELNYSHSDSLFLETPRFEDHGDFATNIAFRLTKELKKSPKEIAETLSQELSDNLKIREICSFEPLNGFTNIRLNDAWIWKELQTRSSQGFPESIHKLLLEFVSANPTGPLHIGHARWAAVGSVIASLLRFTGHTVHTEFYINDAGNQITNLYNSVNAIKEGKPIPEDGYHGTYVHELAKSDIDPLLSNIESQKVSLKNLGVEFDVWFSEKSLHNKTAITDTLDTLKLLNMTYEKDGALWFRSTDHGDDKDRVLIKNDGLYSYFAVDIAYHHNKIKRGFDTLVNIWGADHHGYVPRMKSAVKVLMGDDYDIDQHFKILIGQLVSLKRDGEPVRMSKRTGEMITLDEVVEEIGADATRFFLIQKSMDTHIDFDLTLAKKQSAENPVYYIQYAHARLCQLMAKLDENNIEVDTSNFELTPQERQLIFHILRFEDEVWASATEMLPHKLAQYSAHLAKLFHHFYEHCPILKDHVQVKGQRRYIITKTKETLFRCLQLMGIQAPEKM